ncbi:hypothetical protein ACWC4D_33520 [Streptomyces sp. NPDC001288]
MVAAVEPARSTGFDIVPTNGTDNALPGSEGVLDRSAPGVSSDSYRAADQTAERDPDGRQRKAQGSVWKAWLLAGAQRWGKGGGTANKRIDLRKAKAQAHQVKENRTTTANKSNSIPARQHVGSGAGHKNNTAKQHGNTPGKSHVNSFGNRNTSGKDGPSGRPGNGSASGGRTTTAKDHGPRNNGPSQTNRRPSGTKGADSPAGDRSNSRREHGPKNQTPTGPAGKKHRLHKPGSPDHSNGNGGSRAGKQGPAGAHGTPGKDGKPGTPAAGGKNTSHKNTGHKDTRTPLEKSRGIGHHDGSAVRNVVDHVKAYKDGVVDGYRDTKTDNAKEHDRLDKAHDTHKNPKDTDQKPVEAVVNGQHITITDDNTPLEDPLMAKPTPIQTQGVDATSIILGSGFLKSSISRKELRRFKQYEGRLEDRIDGLARVADATTILAAQARDQATECQNLAEQAKTVKGGEKLVAALTKLADQATVQAGEADEVNRKATKAHDFTKAVLSNIQTRYAPLYQAVVDSDETKPAELKFYSDRGVTPTESALAA